MWPKTLGREEEGREITLARPRHSGNHFPSGPQGSPLAGPVTALLHSPRVPASTVPSHLQACVPGGAPSVPTRVTRCLRLADGTGGGHPPPHGSPQWTRKWAQSCQEPGPPSGCLSPPAATWALLWPSTVLASVPPNDRGQLDAGCFSCLCWHHHTGGLTHRHPGQPHSVGGVCPRIPRSLCQGPEPWTPNSAKLGHRLFFPGATSHPRKGNKPP